MSNLAHEEAVNEFLKAPEPILVEVKRRSPPTTTQQQSITSESSTTALPSIESAPTPTSPTSKPALKTPPHTAETMSIGVQTDLMCNFENEYLFGSHESPVSEEHHLNSQTTPNGRHSHHEHEHHVLSECIVPPDIDIEVILIIVCDEERLRILYTSTPSTQYGFGFKYLCY